MRLTIIHFLNDWTNFLDLPATWTVEALLLHTMASVQVARQYGLFF